MTSQTFDVAEPETLRFGYGETALGIIAVAESARGGVAIFIAVVGYDAWTSRGIYSSR
jgi:hypothetical protein